MPEEDIIRLITKLTMVFTVLIVLMVIYIGLPFFFMGPPVPLFAVNNHDEIEHNVSVEVFDHGGERITVEEGSLGKYEDLTYPRSLWQSLPIPKEYTFKVNVDEKVEYISIIEIESPHSMVDISVYPTEKLTVDTVYIEMELVYSE